MKINKELVDQLKDKTPIAGHAMILAYEVKTSKAGNQYVDGYLCCRTKVPFKIFGGPLMERFLEEDMCNKIGLINAEVNVFNDAHSVLLKTFEEDEKEDLKDYFQMKYSEDQIKAFKKSFLALLKRNLSDKGYQLINEILLSDKKLMESFCTEFSARSHHDNTIGGLLAHTLKMLFIGESVVKIYHSFFDDKPDFKDLFFIGITLHDIGKVKEMHYGEYLVQSSITHRYLGVEMLSGYRKVIEKSYDEKWFYDLLSVIIQHHHIYEERAKTVIAFMVYTVDMMESQWTNILEKIDGEARVTPNGTLIWLDKETPLNL